MDEQRQADSTSGAERAAWRGNGALDVAGGYGLAPADPPAGAEGFYQSGSGWSRFEPSPVDTSVLPHRAAPDPDPPDRASSPDPLAGPDLDDTVEPLALRSPDQPLEEPTEVVRPYAPGLDDDTPVSGMPAVEPPPLWREAARYTPPPEYTSLGEYRSQAAAEGTREAPAPAPEEPAGLPQRVPSEPELPDVPDTGAGNRERWTAPELAWIADQLKRDDVPQPPTERLDVDAVLEAVRGVPGVRTASVRPNPNGVHTLRLDLADDADPGQVSRLVARLLEQRMGLSAAPQEPPLPQPHPVQPVSPPPQVPAPRTAPAAEQFGTRPQPPPGLQPQPPSSIPSPPPSPVRPPPRPSAVPAPPHPAAPEPATVRHRAPDPPVSAQPAAAPLSTPGPPQPIPSQPAPAQPAPPQRAVPPLPTAPLPSAPPPAPPPAGFSPGPVSGPPPPVPPRSADPGRFGAAPPEGGDPVEEDVPEVVSRPLYPPQPGLRVVIEHVRVNTVGLDATVEVQLTAGARRAHGLATGPAVDSYVVRLAAVSAANAIDALLRDGGPPAVTAGGPPSRCFVEHTDVVPFGSTEVAVVVLLLVCGGWVEQLTGSALVGGDPRQAMVRATLGAVNRRLEALLG